MHEERYPRETLCMHLISAVVIGWGNVAKLYMVSWTSTTSAHRTEESAIAYVLEQQRTLRELGMRPRRWHVEELDTGTLKTRVIYDIGTAGTIRDTISGAVVTFLEPDRTTTSCLACRSHWR